MARKRRETEAVSLSFLDVISCGFGSLILLLVLVKVFEPVVLENAAEDLQGYLAQLQEELFEVRGETRRLNRELVRKEDLEAEKQRQLEALNAELSALKAEHNLTQDETDVSSKIRHRLTAAKQSLTEEMKRLLAEYERGDASAIGGVPVDSEYVIFIIDTSGSMFGNAWPLVLRKVEETLEVYPRLKGIQVMNDMGQYMFPSYAGDWIPDTNARRKAIIDRLQTWNAFSNSSPVEGITQAIASFYRPGRKISLYVLGDDFQGRSVQGVLDTVARINRPDAKGERLVRIHGIGFPVQYAGRQGPTPTGIRFTILMRALCEQNGGTFVGLNDFRVF